MATWFLVIIYLSFISLGLPDSMLGSAWPAIYPDIGASLESAGLLSMIAAGGTIVSSLASGFLIERLGTGRLTLLSCCLTAGALLGFSFAPSLLWLVVLAIPLGLGAGAVDSALNHYVANHYKAHHMSWLHCFWGVGATAGPIIMSLFIANDSTWRDGYQAVAMIQFTLVVILLLTLPLWNRVAALQQQLSLAEDGAHSNETQPDDDHNARTSRKNPLQIRGVKLTLIAFLFYCGVEMTVGLWGASFLVHTREFSADTAAAWVSLYFGGITVGRLISGFITMRVSGRAIILSGQLIALFGGLLVLLPLPDVLTLTGIILIGMGFAPIYPSLIHETPARFGKEHSAKLIGYQMAVAYTGTTFLPPLFGLVAAHTTMWLFPVTVIAFILIMLLCTEGVNRALKREVQNG
ncbi:MFS transporter [Marinicrinis lubricantis]|uniref:MFS transporter n=1 Tax=Marinicrinis lubricantis TaxID=2086470 RepID=A0ABW1IK05_9BACL